MLSRTQQKTILILKRKTCKPRIHMIESILEQWMGEEGGVVQAQEEVLVGVGVLAGSSVMLLTIAWAGSLLAGRCDLSGPNATAQDGTLTRGLNLLGTGVTTDEQTRYILHTPTDWLHHGSVTYIYIGNKINGVCLSEAFISANKPNLPLYYVPTYRPTPSFLQTYSIPPNLLGGKKEWVDR